MYTRYSVSMWTLLLGVLAAAGMPAIAHDAGEGTVQQIMQQAIPANTGEQVTVLTVSYAPGAASKPHRHPGAIFAYVTEGSVVGQFNDGQPKTFNVGESWYEAPGTRHMVSRNASDSQPAQIVVFAVGKPGVPLKEPLEP